MEYLPAYIVLFLFVFVGGYLQVCEYINDKK